MDLNFNALAIISINNNNIVVLTKLIAEIWETSRNTGLKKCIWKTKANVKLTVVNIHHSLQTCFSLELLFTVVVCTQFPVKWGIIRDVSGTLTFTLISKYSSLLTACQTVSLPRSQQSLWVQSYNNLLNGSPEEWLSNHTLATITMHGRYLQPHVEVVDVEL